MELIQIGINNRLSKLYSPEVAESFFECAPEVEQGWLFDGATFKTPEPIAPEPVNASALAESFIGKFFTTGQLQHLTILLIQQNPKAGQLYSSWVSVVIQKGLAGETDFENLGDPPFTYEEVAKG